ncbi:ROK family glucokinase [Oceanobacillus alkalisoli]|uniref:ROK family glucokinase n=1 Tax=Oceanobacillus alkalisoli TaxID=2925113 RepID=UPI001F119959|nr:ROK family glucokinase [Oceanobacillus alkalisoli]MCF3945005.1 ROK family glucokinase [Oceanobacillus alkalisoli]
MNELMIGIDIGGTTVKIGLINHDGEILVKWEIPTNKDNAGQAVINDIWTSITEMIAKHKIENEIIGIGVGAPGFINPETGIVEEAVNIGWKNFNLTEELHRLCNLPVFIENDANLAALAENWKGSGNSAENLIFITLGTGVGGGIIANGEILNGTNGTAGEIGHILVAPNEYRCNCGRVGCLEAIASATGIVHMAMDHINKAPHGVLAACYNQRGMLEAKDVFDCAMAGDEASQRIINRMAEALGMAMANLAVTINPSHIIIGGGVSKAGEPLLAKITAAFKKYALPRVSDCCEVKLAQLDNDAGMIGAAYLVKSWFEKQGI